MPLGVTKGIGTWQSQGRTVERFTDNAAYTSAHPDDTLVLAGPPRQIDSDQAEGAAGWKSLLAIGMIQGFQFNSQKPTQPMQAIGSGRSYFVSGKSQTTWRIGRLFCNGRNLNRVLYHNMAASDFPVQNFDDPAALNYKDMYYINLDSELYYVPFGLAAIFKDKMKDLIGAVYLELCMIQSYGVGFNAGQAMIMEDVNGMCDRVLPFHPTAVCDSGLQRETVDAIIGFTDKGKMLGHLGTNLSDISLAATDSEGQGS